MRYLYAIIFLFTLQPNSIGQAHDDGIFYSSLNYAIQLGQLSGVVKLQELKAHGNFGVGSQHGLAGELVLLDGIAYKISVDGHAVIMPDSATLPFAATKFFKPETSFKITRVASIDELQKILDSTINTNRFAAVRITGLFSSIQYKCYLPQQPPYPTIKNSPVKIFDSSHISGTLVGFFTPQSAIVLNSPSYHFHFINEKRTSGGHVDKLSGQGFVVEIDYADQLHVYLPPPALTGNINLNQLLKE